VTEQPPQRPRRPAPQLNDYPHQIADTIRFGDLDPQGHVNQAVFLTYFETGRVAMFRTPDLGVGVPGLTFVMARMEVDYIKELHWPGSVTIGTGVLAFGRSSFKVSQAIFRDGVCCATGLATAVCMDKATRKSTPLPEAALARLNPWKLQGA